MRRFLLAAAAIAALTVSAQAEVITYSFHQVSASYPGLSFTAYYKVQEGVAPHSANSHQTPPDFGGLVELYVEGSGYPAITLADLIPSCEDFGGCVVNGVDHNYGSPDWYVGVPGFFYLEAIDLPDDPFHFEWNYLVTASSIQINDDNGSSPCFQQFGCFAEGFWASDVVPEPASAAVLVGGLLLAPFRRKRPPMSHL